MLTIKVLNYQTGAVQKTVLTPDQMTNQEWSVGRSTNCGLMLESLDVSRTHGKINFHDGTYHYIDLGSANGSLINNQLIQANQPHPLQVNDLIRIADFVLSVEEINAASSHGELLNGNGMGGDRWQDNLTARCVRITDETEDVKTFTFIAESPILFQYQPGQFVTLDLNINGDAISRSYSISSTPSRPHTLEITVKRVPSPSDAPDAPPGLASNWLHDTLKVGSRVQLSRPMGKFTCTPNPAPKLLMISAGSGITPMMSMARWIADRAIESDIVFFHSARTPEDIIFRQELEMMSARLPHFRLAISTTRCKSGHPWFGFTGRLTEALLRVIASDFQDRTVYVCGPNGFMADVKALLEGLAFPMQNYYEESFGAPKKVRKQHAEVAPVPSSSNGHVGSVSLTPSPLPSNSAQAMVLFAQSRKEVAGDGADSLLELAEQEGIKIRSNCRQGVCGACKKRKLEGEVRYDSEPDALETSDREAGYVLTCVATPVGRVVIDA